MTAAHPRGASRWCAPFLSLVLCSSVGLGAVAAQQSPDAVFVHDRADQWFLIGTIGDGLAEHALSALADTRAADTQVKAFAARLAAAHAARHEELSALAHAKDIHAPEGIDPVQQATIDRVGALAGDAFDRAVVSALVTWHQSQVDLLTHEIGSGLDADLRAWAERELPAAQRHLEEAKGLLLRHQLQ